MGRHVISVRSIGEFLGFLVIIIVGAVTTVRVSDRFSPPASEVLAGLLLILVALTGFWWLVKHGPESNAGQNSSLAGLGGALGVLVTDAFVSGDQYIAVGAAIGAGVCAVAGLIWDRRSQSSEPADG